MKRALGTLIGTSILLASSAAFAQEYGGGYSAGYSRYSQQQVQPRRAFYPSGIDNIGNAGQSTLSVERLTGVFFDRLSYGGSTNKTTHLALLGNSGGSVSSMPRAAFDYFVIDGLSVGGSIAYMSHAPSGGSAFLFSPRVGYAYAFDDTFSFWPRVAFTYSHQSSSVSTYNAYGSPVTTDVSASLTQLSLEGMVGISPVKHVAFLVGPYVDIGVGGSASKPDPTTGNTVSVDQKLTSFGLAVDVLTYF